MNLPDKVLRREHPDDASFVSACYMFFRVDFVDDAPQFRKTRMGLKRLPIRDGKEATFYHMTTTGEDEANRTMDVDRSERIRWPRPIIENETDKVLRVWTERMRGENRIHLWHPVEDYVVVLSERKGYFVPWTAFFINYTNYRNKLERRWKRNRETP